jgi:hypothetical protein
MLVLTIISLPFCSAPLLPLWHSGPTGDCEFTISAHDHPELFASLMSNVHAAMKQQQQPRQQQQQQQQQQQAGPEPDMPYIRDAEMRHVNEQLMPGFLSLLGVKKVPAELHKKVVLFLRNNAEQALNSSSSSSSSRSSSAPAKQQQGQDSLVSADSALIDVSMQLQLSHTIALQKLKLPADASKHCQLVIQTVNEAARQVVKDKHQQLLQRQQAPKEQQTRVPVHSPLGGEGEFVIEDDRQLPAVFVQALRDAASFTAKAALMYAITLGTNPPPQLGKPLSEYTLEDMKQHDNAFHMALYSTYALLTGADMTMPISSSSSSSSSAAATGAAAAGARKPDGWGRQGAFAGLKGCFQPKSNSSSSTGKNAGSTAAGSSSSKAAAAEAAVGSAAAPASRAGKGPSIFAGVDAHAGAAMDAAVLMPLKDPVMELTMAAASADSLARIVQTKFCSAALMAQPDDLVRHFFFVFGTYCLAHSVIVPGVCAIELVWPVVLLCCTPDLLPLLILKGTVLAIQRQHLLPLHATTYLLLPPRCLLDLQEATPEELTAIQRQRTHTTLYLACRTTDLLYFAPCYLLTCLAGSNS